MWLEGDLWMSDTKEQCVLEGCTNKLGPEALRISHKGKPVGGICEKCIATVPAFRVLFVLDKQHYARIEEMVPINNLIK
jgi:hypothetical protein